jgi:hypothetical protein
VTAVPTISVVIASKVGAPFLDQCLASLEVQAAEVGAEILVVTPDHASYADRIRTQFEWVSVLSVDEPRVPALRRHGVEAASGDIVAIIEEHCAARDDWLATAIEVLSDERVSAVGGPVLPSEFSTLPDWTVYFCEYNAALPPAPEGDVDNFGEANSAYRRTVLMDHLEVLDTGYWPMSLHPTLASTGHVLHSTGRLAVDHRGPFPFRYYLGQRYLFSRAYTGVRAQQKPLVWRLTYLLLAPLLPIAFLARMTLRVFSKRCRPGRFLVSLPLTVVALVVLVAGEWVGCLLGPGDALERVE